MLVYPTLQPVTIQPKPSQENQPVETSFLDKVEINKSDLSYEELKRGKDIILDYSDIFSKSDTDVGYTNIVQHRISCSTYDNQHTFADCCLSS
jgi:hypothetical protein